MSIYMYVRFGRDIHAEVCRSLSLVARKLEHRALLTVYRARYTKDRSLLTEYRALLLCTWEGGQNWRGYTRRSLQNTFSCGPQTRHRALLTEYRAPYTKVGLFWQNIGLFWCAPEKEVRFGGDIYAVICRTLFFVACVLGHLNLRWSNTSIHVYVYVYTQIYICIIKIYMIYIYICIRVRV